MSVIPKDGLATLALASHFQHAPYLTTRTTNQAPQRIIGEGASYQEMSRLMQIGEVGHVGIVESGRFRLRWSWRIEAKRKQGHAKPVKIHPTC